MKKIVFETDAYKNFEEWKIKSPQTLSKIEDLIIDIKSNPFKGIGKPEPLKHNHKGCWSRRINLEHRLIYRVTSDSIQIISCKGHYG